MEEKYEVIEIGKWKRAAHYNFFRGAENPFFGVSYNVDITHFYGVIRERSLPFYYSMIYAVTGCANRIEAFRYRIVENQAVLYKDISPSFRCMEKETDLFKVVTVECKNQLSDFISDAKTAEENQKLYFQESGRQDVYDISCIPWISFTHVTHTQSGDRDYSVPNFTWGKHFRDGDKILLPFSVQVHHSFADGIDLGKFAATLQDYLDNFE